MRRIKRKTIIIISIIVLILIVASIVVTMFLLNKNNEEKQESNINIEELENHFSTIFTNTVYPGTDENKEKVYEQYNIETDETGKYKINANIPNIKIATQITQNINDDIFQAFVKPISQILGQERAYTIYNVDYASYINNNILSIVIKCNLKEGSNPQRVVIRTYNYDMENDKILTLQEITNIKNLNQEEVQNKVLDKIKSEIEKVSAIKESGYNVYKRNIDNTIYKLENTTEFFLGENNILYIVYSYGNSGYTSEVDLVIYE